ncbi:glycerate kinase, partial [Chloroflexota bacterium]
EAGIVIVKEGHSFIQPNRLPEGIEILEARHPLPDARGLAGTERISKLLAGAEEKDLVICLISGGGSALFASLAPGLTLGNLQELTDALLACGASINEINTLRKHLEPLKGGGLARLAAPARLLTLILSDVVGNPLDIIASGPTAPDPSTFQEAQQILARYSLLTKTPGAIISHLEKGLHGQMPETPKPGDPLFERVQNVIIGDNYQAAEAAIAQAQAEGFNTHLLTTHLQGQARQVGHFLAAIARQAATTGQPLARPACIVAGGETTVSLQGAGLGGRNQELALGAVEALAGLPNTALVALATDGGDGPTDAAGALVTGETLQRALQLGLSPAKYLANNDSYNFFKPLGDLLLPGPTQTNVNDLNFIFTF